jgi:biopolymer transport protein ExbD
MSKMLDMPGVAAADTGIPVKDAGEVREATILVTAVMKDGKPVIMVNEQEVPEDQLVERLREAVNQTGKRDLAVLADKAVPWRVVMMIQDRAKGAGVARAYHLVIQPGAEEKK